MISSSAMDPGGTTPAGPVAPAIMRIGAARMTAGLDRYPRLDLEAHRDLFGRLPRLSESELIGMAQQVDLRGHGGAAFPSARKLQAVVDALSLEKPRVFPRRLPFHLIIRESSGPPPLAPTSPP